jgi:hypothetical protein
MRPVYVSAALVAIVATMAACSSSDKNPGSPTTPTPTVAVRAVTVTATPRAVGSYQLTAKADLSDGSSRDVTNDAQWTTSNADVATVSAAGVLTALRSGQIEVRATYQNVTGSTTLAVTAPPPPSTQLIILSGTTSETPPAEKPIPDVTIRITAGPGAGQSIVTDSQGRFGFTQFPAGRLSLEATKAGYVTYQLSDLEVTADRELQIVMFPTPPTDSSGATATARCNDGSWSWAQTRADACSANGGIAYGVCPGPLCTTQTVR